MILRLNKNKTLSIYRNTPVYIGENKFNKITFLLPESIDNNLVSELLFKVHVVNSKGEYMLVNLAVEDNNSILQGSIDIDKVITDESQMLNIYVEMYDNEDKIGKTNCIELFVNPLPDEKERIYSYQELLDRIQELENENEEQEETIKTIGQLIEENTEAMNRINGFHDGNDGQDGTDGKSAYEVAVANGFIGTEREWVDSLKGADGRQGVDGKSAYQVAVDNGYVGTEEEWLLSLKGDNGRDGKDGNDGQDGVSPTVAVSQTASGATIVITDVNGEKSIELSNGADGQDYNLTNQDKQDIADIVLSKLPTTQGVQYGNTSN